MFSKYFKKCDPDQICLFLKFSDLFGSGTDVMSFSGSQNRSASMGSDASRT
jgi:hypothetical protein